jgi:glycosyltransferase involved in cell wall biosynthesis
VKVLFLPNWQVHLDPWSRQAPDYVVPGRPYWFFRHFRDPVKVDVLDVARWPGFGFEDRYLHFYAAQGLVAAAVRGRYDVVLVHGSQSAVALLAIARTLRITMPPVVVIDVGAFNHGHPEKRVSFELVRWGLRSAARVIWHSTGSMRMAVLWAPEIAERGEVIHFGTDIAQWSPGSEDGDFALCVGYANRDFELLREAWAMVPDVPLVILGADPAAFPGITAKFTGRVSFAEYQQYVAGARLLVHPLPESAASFGQMTLLDAFAAARPVVVTDVAPVRDYLGAWCERVQDRDPAALAASVRRLWDDGAERARMGAAARRAAESLFSEREMALRIEQILRSCVEMVD